MKKKNYFIFIIMILYSCNKENVIISNEFYQLNLFTDTIVPIHDKIDCQLTIDHVSQDVLYDGKIERRGGFSIAFPKHSYELDLKADIVLANLPADDDWILNANYIDKTFMRHALSYELFRLMNPNNKAAQTSYVQLDLNNKYQGLYVLMEKLDKSGLAIDGQDKNAVIFKEPPLFRMDNFTPQDSTNYHQQTYPKIEKNNKSAFIEEIRRFLTESDEVTFSNRIATVFDIENIIDWHLLLLLTNNNDGILKNFYLYKVNGVTPLRIAPWDYDHSFGRDGDNELNLITRPLRIERSLLFVRLLKFNWYKEALKNRWEILNEQSLFTVAGLLKRVEKYQEKLIFLTPSNFDKWPVNSSFYYDNNTFEAEVEIIKKYIPLRHTQLTTYFKEL